MSVRLIEVNLGVLEDNILDSLGYREYSVSVGQITITDPPEVLQKAPKSFSETQIRQFINKLGGNSNPPFYYVLAVNRTVSEDLIRTQSYWKLTKGSLTTDCLPVSIEITDSRYIVTLAPIKVSAAQTDTVSVSIRRIRNAKEPDINGTVRISISKPQNEPITVSYSTSGTAIAGKNYVALPGTIIIPKERSFVDLTIIPIDSASDSISKSLNINLTGVSSDIELSGTNIATSLTITNTDPVINWELLPALSENWRNFVQSEAEAQGFSLITNGNDTLSLLDYVKWFPVAEGTVSINHLTGFTGTVSNGIDEAPFSNGLVVDTVANGYLFLVGSNLINGVSRLEFAGSVQGFDFAGWSGLTRTQAGFDGTSLTGTVNLTPLANLVDARNMFDSTTITGTVDLRSLSSLKRASHMFLDTLITSVEGLSSLDLDDAQAMFSNCTVLDWDPDTFTMVPFSRCTNLTQTFNGNTLLNFPVDVQPLSNVTIATSMFSGSGVTRVDNFSNMSSLQFAQFMFLNTANLTTVPDLSGLSSAITVQSMFENSGITGTVDLSSLTSINNATSTFKNSKITTVTGLDTLTFNNWDQTFRGCTELSESAIDSILAQCDIGGTTNGTLDLRDNTGPSSTGLATRDNLIAKGWTVKI